MLFVYIVKLKVAFELTLRLVLFVHIVKLKVAFELTCVWCCLDTSYC